MNSKMMHQAGRVLVALVLVVCLLVAWSPIRAEATTAATGFVLGTVGVGAPQVIAACIIGLGIMAGVTSIDFDSLVSDLQSHLSDLGWISDGLITVGSIAAGSTMKYAVPKNLLEDIRDYIVSTAVVAYKYNVLTSNFISSNFPYASDSIKERMLEASSYAYIVVYGDPSDSNSNYSILVSDVEFITYINNLGYTCFDAEYMGHVFLKASNGGAFYPVETRVSLPLASLIWYYTGLNNVQVETKQDLTLGNISLDDTALEEAYTTWGSSALKVYEYSDGSLNEEPEDSDTEQVPVPYWPLSIQQTYEETISQTQEEAQSGESTYVDPDSATVGDIFSKLVALPSNIAKAFADFFSPILSWLESIWNAILSIPQMIADLVVSGISAIFVPSEDFLTEKVEAIRAEFGFADSIIATGELLSNTFSGINTEPPVIYIDLGAAEGSYYLGSKEVFLDLSWYSRYKETGDAIISAFLWLAFIWRVFLKAPGIISGMPGDFFLPTPSASNESVAVRKEERRSGK